MEEGQFTVSFGQNLPQLGLLLPEVCNKTA